MRQVEQLSLEDFAPAPREVAESISDGVAASDPGRVHVVDLTGSDVVVEVTDASPTHLSPRDRRILALERQWFCNAGSKEAEITRQFGISPTRYFQILNGLLDDPRAMREYPQVVARLRRLRTTRRGTRRRYRRVLRNGH